jgi:hypothetical protein
VVSPLGTPTFQPATQVPVRTPTQTPLPPASVASPTGGAPLATLPPTLTMAPPEGSTLTPEATATLVPTADATSTVAGPIATATPQPTEDATPVIFAAQTTPGSGSPTPGSTEEVAGQEGRSGTMALLVGGSAIGLAGLVAAGFLFVRSRKS